MINSDGSKEWRKDDMNRWGELDDEGWKMSTASGLADRRGRAGGVPEFSVALGEVYGVHRGSCRLWRVVDAHSIVCLSLIPQPVIFWSKTPCFFTCDCFPSGTGAASSCPRWPCTCASLPKVVALFCNILLLLLPQEILLTWIAAVVWRRREGNKAGERPSPVAEKGQM